MSQVLMCVGGPLHEHEVIVDDGIPRYAVVRSVRTKALILDATERSEFPIEIGHYRRGDLCELGASVHYRPVLFWEGWPK